ncbi:hypothetical protein LX81_02831 [Palleronia aestuarii]|uniref:4-amino-4-deoxy-L-arabinose transferase-like glycosyltransferase n=1 Tax=Palleronia aestuarii TaxID=568105 RepID=A0A2W7N8D8_9RHOB|nr:hypothetical protein [Palleronia aestuarii]PZX14457.1 hypothetical protein LX81_02831 [Palleronia aestuarii]
MLQRRTIDPATAGAIGVAVLGALLYGLLASPIGPLAPNEAFGNDIYDYYFLSILDGRLDVPARILRLEGHYTPDGTGYLYHGLAPLLTRFAVGWAWPLPEVSMAYASVWFWAVSGTAFYHLAFATVAGRFGPPAGLRRVVWSVVLAFGIWFASPGLLFAVRPSLFHEPNAVAYAMGGGFVFLWTRNAVLGRPWGWTLPGLAICAAIALHARPNVAVGLYAGVVIALGLALLRDRQQAIRPALLAIAILGVSGLGFLGLNAVRFGSAVEVHGSYDAESLSYGPVFWGHEMSDSPRASAFEDYGRFNLGRILPNAMLYGLDLPEKSVAAPPSEAILSAYRAATEGLGFIRIEPPRIGAVWLWAPWIVVGMAAFAARGAPRRLLGLVAATGIAAVLTLAYGTVTLRYRFDTWPLFAAVAVVGLYRIAPALGQGTGRPILSGLLVAATLFGVGMTALTAMGYRDEFSVNAPTNFFVRWTREECIAKAKFHDFSQERLDQICALPGETDPAS